MPSRGRSGTGNPIVRRVIFVGGALALTHLAVGAQVVRLAMQGQNHFRAAAVREAAPVAAKRRPDLLDRDGRLLATDVPAPSLYADPAILLDANDAAAKLASILPDINEAALRSSLGDRSRRFVWLRRGLPPAVAQKIHDLGTPGLVFKEEYRRVYPAGASAGRILGYVDGDGRGLAGAEKALDRLAHDPARAPRLAMHLGVQHALEEELKAARSRHGAVGAAGILLDVTNGEVIALASVPGVDPARPRSRLEAARADRVMGGTYELGSIFKLFTAAMALEGGHASLDTVFDVRQPLQIGRFTIRDLHPSDRPLTLEQIVLRSSNVGAALIARLAGADAQRNFLSKAGLLAPMRTDFGAPPAPRLPERWGEAETATISYGHGVACAPLQVAAAAAALVNGGTRVAPAFWKRRARTPQSGRVVGESTSETMRRLLRANVTAAEGTGKLADAPGYRVGGKTGTAEIASGGSYRKSSVIASFLGAFPMDAPRYVALVMVFEPKDGAGAGEITGGTVAAPVMSRFVTRAAPLLGVAPIFDDVATRGGPTP